MKRTIRFLVVMILGAMTLANAETGASSSRQLERLLDDQGGIWKATNEDFVTANEAYGFRWMTATTKDAARTANPNLTFLGMRVWEAVARFENGHLLQLTLSLYNRGDAGNMTIAEFQKLLTDSDKLLTQWTGAKGTLFRAQERSSFATLRRKAWVKGPYRIDLIWGFSEKSQQQGIDAASPEFARLEVTRFDPRRDPRRQIIADTGVTARPVTAFDLRSRPQRKPNGDVVIAQVPMVDQGQKGYCAAAVAERLLRYYGRNVDEHEIAQLARTSADDGTSQASMVGALRRIGDENKLDFTVLYDFKTQEFERLIQDYNRLAKRSGKPDAVMYGSLQGNTRIIDPMATYRALDSSILKEARLKRETGMMDFKNNVIKSINAGVPLAWSVMLGLVKESEIPQSFGGHMRLIIGINTRTGDIYYTDTWGAGHELKKMTLADAWAITTGLYCLHPRDILF
jgi:hypothetical protein